MSFGTRLNYYELLEVSQEASNREIHEAYLRIKAAYSNESMALYSLVTPEERERTLTELEEAYIVLTNEDRRREYDEKLQTAQHEETQSPFSSGADIVSIDRVPPMEFGASEDLLIPPALDTAPLGSSTRPEPVAPPKGPPSSWPKEEMPAPEIDLKQLIAQEIEWKGALLKKIRELRGVSVEDMCAATKLSKTYLHAIENEDFQKLPAPVFVRGFVVQICKTLKLPHEQAAAAYMARCYQARQES